MLEIPCFVSFSEVLMAHTFTRLYFHIIFSTKHRQPLIDSELEERLHPYLGGIIREMGGVAIRVGGVPNHVHLLAQLPAGPGRRRAGHQVEFLRLGP
jgi:REP element-mobilizing transposase RayT